MTEWPPAGGPEPTIRPLDPADRRAVVELWAACDLLRPWNDPERDIDRKLAQDPKSLIVLQAARVVVGTVMVGYDGHRGWVNYLAVHPDHRHAGYGRMLMAAAEAYLDQLGCPKLNLQIRKTNTGAVAFYERLGFVVDDAVSMGKRLIPDD